MPLIPELIPSTENKSPKVILLGSGGLSIGQAGEFDYSGTQAVKALTEEGIHVVIVNPNIATVQTNPIPNTTVYLYPVDPVWVEKVIAKEKPTAIIASFGGQTALNCLLELEKKGVLNKYNVKNLGSSPKTLELTEDRDLFASHMQKISKPIPPSIACETPDEAKKAAGEIGYPVIVRAAYALGGLGSGFADNEKELLDLVIPALATSPQVLVEKSLKGWKEVEYEVMRDSQGNTITICNMENFDPLGIHTGDSIVVCPSQSLSDDEYQLLRNAAIDIINSLEIIGECNVQYALNPHSLEYFVIEVNARLSRSSALASKASGYPIAYIAGKVVLGYDLLEIKNPVTRDTYAFTEPALDYITIKIPRWDLTKFQGASRLLGSTMKSVGEVMGIGRSFPEALQKAVRMVSENSVGLSVDFDKDIEKDSLVKDLKAPTDTRLFNVLFALRKELNCEEIHDFTAIDKWFLKHLESIVHIEQELLALANKVDTSQSEEAFIESALQPLNKQDWKRIKSLGFGDGQIAAICLSIRDDFNWSERSINKGSLVARRLRKQHGVKPVFKKIDTTAAEYPSPSNYLYLSYGGDYNDPIEKLENPNTAVIIGCGPYRIGTSVEFDWCAVSCSQKLKASKWNSVIVNCNPETVSTDYNCSDKLYFEELSLERILDICEIENPDGVIASMGGQTPNKLALPLAAAGQKLLGHSPETIDSAEDRSKFSALLDELNIDQPRWIKAKSETQIDNFCEEVGFPVLVRPSYVLSGAAMRVAYDRDSLKTFLGAAAKISVDHPVVISEFITGAREIELDGVAKNGIILSAIAGEHIENAGVHSGDATTVVPAQRLYVETVRRVRKAASKIAKSLNLNGPFNMQFLAKFNHIRVIECNARAARTFPFISKVVSQNFAEAATEIMIGKTPKITHIKEDTLEHVGVKAPMFSFTRLPGVDPVLGVEMASTGEVGCIGADQEEALLLALKATHIHPPKKGILVSAGPEAEKMKFLQSAKYLSELNIPIYATKGTADFLNNHGFKTETLAWPEEGEYDVLDAIKDGKVDFVINIPKNLQQSQLTYGAMIRKTAVNFNCPILTNMEKVTAYIHALSQYPNFEKDHEPQPLPGYLV